jgi:hypothetical protein
MSFAKKRHAFTTSMHCSATNVMQVSWSIHALKNAAAGGEALACLDV